MAPGGLRFHDLRHSYATELVSRGVPVNDVQAVMGHAQPLHPQSAREAPSSEGASAAYSWWAILGSNQ
ncbi:tyrosine-type recombinase/integrase [Micromonospora sp. NPDC004551]|uniref:tyrosine-type recombinase/integrase n=1 Tax=Micromonospora sp. NPDC004551 TaxID=3154284 RepID=UPI0033A97CFA